jgi:hypothetical protein
VEEPGSGPFNLGGDFGDCMLNRLLMRVAISSLLRVDALQGLPLPGVGRSIVTSTIVRG